MTTAHSCPACPNCKLHVGWLLADDFFRECLKAAASNAELVREFDRMFGHNLSRAGTHFDLMIDDATGRTEPALRAFIDFVREVIFERLRPPC